MTTRFNVMLSCAGRRNYLAGWFSDALKAAGLDGEVLVADASPDAPAMLEAGPRGTVLPPLSDPGYFDALLGLCEEKSVRLLVPLNDFELPGLARQAERFRGAGIVPAVSPPEVVDLCFDKWRTFTRLTELGIPVPATKLGLAAAKAALRAGELKFPLIVKPRWGTGSIGVEVVRDERQLELAYAWQELKLAGTAVGLAGDAPVSERILVQQGLSGPEFGIDLIHDLDGGHRAVITKRKLSMRAGETDRAVTEPNEAIAALVKKIGLALKPRGMTDCDAFLTPDGPRILELNPRFGGGYPFSHAAGADVPAALIAWARGADAKPEWLAARPSVVSAKCDRLVSRAA